MALDFDFFKNHMRGFFIKDEKICFSKIRSAPSFKQTSPARYDTSKREAVFKIVSYSKTRRGAALVLNYIAKHSEGLENPVEIIDEYGAVWQADDLHKAIKRMDLDTGNRNRQTVHFIVSFPKGADLPREKTEAFMMEYMQPFAQSDYAYFIGIHTHQSANHAHVLLKMDNGERRLKFDIPQLEIMRERQVKVGRKYGLIYQATRKRERYLGLQQGTRPQKKTLLERQVPLWYARRQAEQKRLAMGFQSDVTALKYDIGEQTQQTLSVWLKGFSNPARAEQLFIEMYAEKPKTALWYANHRANVFGECETQPDIKLTEKALGRISLEKSIKLSSQLEIEQTPL